MAEIVSFSSWLKARRRALDLTQAELARLVGCTVATIKKIEQDQRRPSKDIAERLALALELSVTEREGFVQSARGLRGAGPEGAPLAVPSLSGQGAPSNARRLLSNLPAQRTPLIGRAREIAQLQSLLLHGDVGLVTLTGPGGIGKTRLALEVAATLQDEFADGVRFVALASITDPTLVLTTIAHDLGVRDSGEHALQTALRGRRLLLALDNFEQVLGAAVDIARLLQAAPALKVLVTSRAPLRLAAEHQFAVPPLTAPDVRRGDAMAQLTQSEAGTLFVARAQSIMRGFTVTPSNAPAIAGICAQLDGLPLAIELAAARVKVLPPAELLQRLAQRLPLLTGGPRDLPARQQTIRGTIDWSYQLLDPWEQILFRRLGVFAGGWTLAAAEAVCSDPRQEGTSQTAQAGDSLSVLDGLQALVDHSLVQQEERGTAAGKAQAHLGMLELVREYAYERLEGCGELPAVQRLHVEHYLALAEAGAREAPGGPAQIRWFDGLEAEYDNLRAALQWTLDRREGVLAVRLAAALGDFWQRQSNTAEGCRWLNAALIVGAGVRDVIPALYAEALFTLTTIVSWGGAVDPAILAAYPPRREPLDALLGACQALYEELGDSVGIAAVLGLRAWKAWRSDYELAGALHAEQLALARATGNRRGIAEALKGLGRVVYNLGDFERAFALFEESLALQQALGDQREIAGMYFDLGVAAYYGSDFPRAAAWLERMLALWRELGNLRGDTGGLIHLAGVAGYQGDGDRARRLLDEAKALERELGGDPRNALIVRFEGQVACQQGDWTAARTAYAASLRKWQAEGVQWEIAACLEGLGRVADGQGDCQRAARVWGAAAELRAQLRAPLLPVDHAWYEAAVAHTRALLGDAACAAAWAEGRTMPLEQSIAYALVDVENV